MDRLFVSFIIGISFSATFISHSYLSLAFQKGGTSVISSDVLDIGVRMAIGLANVLLVYMGNTVQDAAVVGALLGFCLSLIGRFAYNLPTTLFGYDTKTAWRVHIIAPLMYAAIFVILVRNLNRVLLPRHTAAAAI